jgi:uncharacterized protein YigE (DUF2233 family)
MRLAFLTLLAAMALPGAIAAPVTLFRFDTGTSQLRLFLRDANGHPYGGFDRLAADLATRGQRLVFAMNAGMFEPDLSPTGLFVADGRELAPLNERRAPGNFYLQPNGVFVLAASGPRLFTTADYARARPAGVRLATQSGPMLLVRGHLAPAVAVPAAESSARPASRFTRNGVCVDGRVVTFAIADTPMTLREFASWLRDVAGCRDALYLDGAVSKVHDVRTGRDDAGSAIGPIIAVVEAAEP